MTVANSEPRPWLEPEFTVPIPPDAELMAFAVLGPEHNESDLDAWTSSMDHIHATPGFRPDGWPQRPYSLEENRADLDEHRDHHRRRLDFAWTVLDPARPGTVIGCVYLKPDRTGEADGEALAWLRADRADLEPAFRQHLREWFATAWPIQVRFHG